MTVTPTALLVGAFGTGDVEDDMLIDAFAAALPGWRLLATAYRRRRVRCGHGAAFVGSSDRRAVDRALRDAEAVIFTGDQVFAGTPPYAWLGRIHRAALLALAARGRGTHLAIVGTGVSAIEDRLARIAARTLVRLAELLIVNDDTSAHILATAGATPPFRVGTDPAWFLMDAVSPRDRRGDTLVVAVDERVAGPDLDARLATALAPVVADRPVALQPWGTGPGRFDDRPLAEAVAERLDGRAEILPPPSGLQEVGDTYRDVHALISLRPRATIAAAAAGVPVLALVDSDRHAAVANGLGQLVVRTDAPGSEVGTAVAQLVTHEPADRDNVRAHIDRAREAVRLLHLVLSQGETLSTEIARLELRPAPWRR